MWGPAPKTDSTRPPTPVRRPSRTASSGQPNGAAPSLQRLLEMLSDHDAQLSSLRQEQEALRQESQALRQALCTAGLLKEAAEGQKKHAFQPPARQEAVVSSPSAEAPVKSSSLAAATAAGSAGLQRSSSTGAVGKVKRQSVLTATTVAAAGKANSSSSAGSTSVGDSSLGSSSSSASGPLRRSNSVGSILGGKRLQQQAKAAPRASVLGVRGRVEEVATDATASPQTALPAVSSSAPAVPASWSGAANAEQQRRQSRSGRPSASRSVQSSPAPSPRQRSASLPKESLTQASTSGRRSSSGSPLRRSTIAGGVKQDLYEIARPLLDAGASQEKRVLALGAMSRALRAGASAHTWQGPESPLRTAVQMQSTDMVKLLLEARASPDEKDAKCVSVLHCAAFDGLETVCKLLLEAKANANAADQHGQTALFFAPVSSICDLLLAQKADIESVNQKGQSALHLASRAGLTEVLVWLASRVSRETIDLRDVHGATAAYYARHAGVSSEFLAKHKLSVVDSQPYNPASKGRRRSSVLRAEAVEDGGSRGRSRRHWTAPTGLSREPLPPLLEDQQSSEEEDSKECTQTAGTLGRPEADSLEGRDVEESEEELPSSTSVAPLGVPEDTALDSSGPADMCGSVYASVRDDAAEDTGRANAMQDSLPSTATGGIVVVPEQTAQIAPETTDQETMQAESGHAGSDVQALASVDIEAIADVAEDTGGASSMADSLPSTAADDTVVVPEQTEPTVPESTNQESIEAEAVHAASDMQASAPVDIEVREDAAEDTGGASAMADSLPSTAMADSLPSSAADDSVVVPEQTATLTPEATNLETIEAETVYAASDAEASEPVDIDATDNEAEHIGGANAMENSPQSTAADDIVVVPAQTAPIAPETTDQETIEAESDHAGSDVQALASVDIEVREGALEDTEVARATAEDDRVLVSEKAGSKTEVAEAEAENEHAATDAQASATLGTEEEPVEGEQGECQKHEILEQTPAEEKQAEEPQQLDHMELQAEKELPFERKLSIDGLERADNMVTWEEDNGRPGSALPLRPAEEPSEAAELESSSDLGEAEPEERAGDTSSAPSSPAPPLSPEANASKGRASRREKRASVSQQQAFLLHLSGTEGQDTESY